MKVLITGGAGFIGSNLCHRLAADEHFESIRVIDDLSTGFLENLSGIDVEVHEASILDEAALSAAADGCDAIVHLAALGSVPRSIKDPIASHEANATGTLRVLEAARNIGNAQVLLASSSSVYGANPALPKKEDLLCMPMSPYAVTKLAAEQYAMAYAQCFDLPVLPFRFFNVFGPRQRPGHVYAAVIPAFLSAALQNEQLPLHGDGLQSRDFTFVDTVTAVIADALRTGKSSSPTNLAFGTRTTLLELIEVIGEEVGHQVNVASRPARPGDVRHSEANNDLLRSQFPDVVPVSLLDGIAETATWMRQFLGSRP